MRVERGAAWKPSFLIAVLLPFLLAACVSSRRPMPGFDAKGYDPQPEVRVQVFEPGGAAATPSVLVGKDAKLVGKLEAAPWGSRKLLAKRRLQRAKAAQNAKSGTSAKPIQQGGQKKGNAGKGASAAKPGPGGQNGKQGQTQGAPEIDLEDPFGDEDLYARFGSRIVINPDGTVTKPYYVDAQTGTVLQALLDLSKPGKGKKAGAALYQFGSDPKNPATVLDNLLGGYKFIIQRIPAFDQIPSFPLQGRAWNGAIPGPQVGIKNDLVLVTSEPDGLESFEQAMDLFYASVPQVLIEARVLEFSHDDTLDLGVKQSGTNSTLKSVGKGRFVKSLVSTFPNSAAGTQGSSTASEGLLTIGGIHDNLELNAILEVLQSQNKSDIISNPRIAVRNGGMAVIDTTSKIPYPRATISGNNVKTSISFEQVGITMHIRPFVTPGESVHLEIQIKVSAVTSFADTDPIPTPVVSTRSATTYVIVPSGKSTAIGGLITKSRFENESKIPLLGDLPILGYLFRSTFVQTTYNEVVFIISPKVVYGFEGFDEELTGSGY